MKNHTLLVALLLAGLLTLTASPSQAQGHRVVAGPRFNDRVVVASPVVVAPPSFLYIGQDFVTVSWYQNFSCYGYYYQGLFFGWHPGERRFIRGYGNVVPVPVNPPAFASVGLVTVPVIYYPQFNCYGYYWNNVFFGWHMGEQRFIRGYHR